jgi:peptidoglycan/LPS O-acetylase OafA/YrhL
MKTSRALATNGGELLPYPTLARAPERRDEPVTTLPFSAKQNNLDFVRLVLALLVTFSHSYPLGSASESREPFFLLTRGQVTGGHIAVDLFFIISGFLIAASAERSSTIWQFLKKRVSRIYPAFCVLALFTVIVVFPLSSASFATDRPAHNALEVVLNTLALREFPYQHAFMDNPKPNVINGSLWSISYEFWCYVGVALLSLSGLLRSRRVLYSIFLASVAVSIFFDISGWAPGGKILGIILGYPPIWARLLPMYMAGVVFYKSRNQIPTTPALIVSCFGLLAIAAFVPHGWTVIFPFAGTYLVFAFAYHPAIPNLHGARFGDLSYGTYLYAFPVLQLIVHWIGHSVNPLVLFGLATPPTLLLALASWHGIERWFLQKSHSGDWCAVTLGVERRDDSPRQRRA